MDMEDSEESGTLLGGMFVEDNSPVQVHTDDQHFVFVDCSFKTQDSLRQWERFMSGKKTR